MEELKNIDLKFVSELFQQKKIKICNKCKMLKIYTDFYTSGLKKDGTVKYASHCKVCKNNKVKEIYKKNNPLGRILVKDKKSRICKTCKVDKPFTEYYKKGFTSVNKYQIYFAHCKKCYNIKQKQRKQLREQQKNK